MDKKLREFVSNYESNKGHLIFMNFGVEKDGTVLGLAEGSKHQRVLQAEHLEDYKYFLTKAIEYYEEANDFFNGDHKLEQKLTKYKLYLKRLERVL